jgi:hypothetical protein
MGGRIQAFADFIADAQALVLAVLFSGGVALVLFQPEIPRVPPIVGGILAVCLLFGPPLLAFFVTMFEKFRQDNRETVWLVNGVTDEREKYLVQPEVLDEMEVNGPGPQPVNDGRDVEVREFTYHEGTDVLEVRGTYMEALSDSKLVTCKAYLEDIHGDMADAWMSLNRLRGRISRMGLQVQEDVINEEAEANERGQMRPKSAVGDALEDARKSTEAEDDGEISELGNYVDDYASEHGVNTTEGVPQTREQAATDGGSDP